jgi:CII-binding regulator of phage lambda lysogenization HflD
MLGRVANVDALCRRLPGLKQDFAKIQEALDPLKEYVAAIYCSVMSNIRSRSDVQKNEEIDRRRPVIITL